MNEPKKIMFIYLLSLSFSLLGFWVDGDVREPSIITNCLEIMMMSFILFAFFSLSYTIIFYSIKWIKRLH